MPVRRAVFLLIPLLMVLASACGGGEEAPQGTPQATRPAGPVTITFWHSMTAANEDTLKAIVQSFNASQSDVTVNLVFQGTYDDSLNKFLASLGRASELPALIQIEDASTQLMVDSQEVVPVQDLVDRDKYDLSNFEPRVLDYYRVNDRLYSMPFNLSSPVLYYNKNDFREVGLDPEKPPSTLEEVKAYSEKLLQKDGSGNITRSGIAIDVYPWIFEEWLAKAGALYVNNGNGRDARATEAIFNGAEGKTIFEWWADMVKSGLAFNVGRNPSGADGLLAVASGRASMHIATSAALRSVFDVIEAGGAQGIDLGVGPMPGPQSPDGGISVAGASLWILKARPEAEQEAAWKFIQYLVEPEQQATWYAGSGYFPIRGDAFDLPAAQQAEARYPYLRVAPQELQAGARNRATQGFLLGPFSKIRSEIVAPAIESMILTNTPPDEAIDKAARDATQAIQEYNKRIGE
jgi:sn-glycerol 3-phosphate transport system substrate-binding protein